MVTACLRLKDAYPRIEVMAHRGAEQRLGSLLLRLVTSRDRQSRGGRRDRASVSVSHNPRWDGSALAAWSIRSVKVWSASTWRPSPITSLASPARVAANVRQRAEPNSRIER
jgi:hypothetical protein